MKRKLYFSIATLLLGLTSCTGPKDNFTITGKIDGVQKVYVMNTDFEPLDSSEVVDGKFTLTGEARPTEWGLFADSCNPDSMTLIGQFYLEAGDISMELSDRKSDIIEGKFIDTYEAVGTPANDAAKEYTEKALVLMQNQDSLGAYELARAAIEGNLDNIFGLEVFASWDNGHELYSQEECLRLLDSFSDEIKNTLEWKYIHDESVQQDENLSMPYKDFSLSSINADEGTISLKSIVEREDTKYVLLDFWASWCGPCMGEVPFLTEVYAEYKDKGFEIFGCSLDDDRNSWMGAVNGNGMNWIHVSDLNGWENAGAVLYGVRSIPANFLIDCSTGMIIASNLRGSQVSSKLSELL